MITIRSFTTADRLILIQLMTELQNYIAAIDPLQRNRAADDFDAQAYIDQLQSTLQRESGILFVAEENDALLGFIAGSIPEDAEDMLDHYPAREGKIHELVVSEKHREKGIGRLLMEKLEEQFRGQGCEYIRVGCFAPNKGAHSFYEKYGYHERYIEMLKRL